MRSLRTTVRPTLSDVQRLSQGNAATRRGIGSRQVPHRLNSQERTSFEVAQQRGFAVVIGTGVRRERHGSPLLNILRQRADALCEPLVWVQMAHRNTGPNDHCLVDFSPLRCNTWITIQELQDRCITTANGFAGVAVADHMSTETPFHSHTELDTLPIWALAPQIIKFICKPEDSKVSKRLAAALVADLGISCAPQCSRRDGHQARRGARPSSC